MASIRCRNGGTVHTHGSVADVKDCYQSTAYQQAKPVQDAFEFSGGAEPGTQRYANAASKIRQDAVAKRNGTTVGPDAWAEVTRLRKAVAPYLVHPTQRGGKVGYFALASQDASSVKFYRVKRAGSGRWEGKVFVDAQASDEHYPVKNPETLKAVLGGIVRNPKAAAELYASELGQCYRCGRTLTDDLSRELGIGPVCRGKHGVL